MKSSLLSLSLIFLLTFSYAESIVYFQNNSQYPLSVSTTSTLSGSYWNNLFSGTMPAWELQKAIFETNRDSGITWGDDFYFYTTVTYAGESVTLELRLHGDFIGSTMYQSSSGPGFSDPWYSDRSFHSNTFILGGKQFVLKYRADLPPGNIYDDVYFVLHEVDPYPQLASDLTDSHIFNVLAYNIFMLTPPIGSSDEYDRAKIIYNHVHGYDAIIISEAFYNGAREDELLPRLSAEYPYQTSVVDESGSTEDGGVLIVSRWPIEIDEHITFDDCGGSDCLAAKGAKYARINKLGQKYHLFGTHTQAFPEPANITIRQTQFNQLKTWILSKTIPQNEPILIGGDLNVDKLANTLNEYDIMNQILETKPATLIGDNFTYDGSINTYGDPGIEYLDYVLVDTTHFSPEIFTNQTQILRHVESVDDLWDNNDLELDLSDHFAVHGRFVYPKITVEPIPDIACEGGTIELSVTTNIPLSYQWIKDGTEIPAANSNTLTLNNVSLSDAGNYYCQINYSCGKLESATVAVTISSMPATPTISTSNNVLTSSSPINNQWYDSNGAILGATNQVHVAATLDDYYVVVTDGACSATSSLSNVTTLPVELLAFSGIEEEKYNRLIWETASEINSSHFEIEKSETNIDFKRINIVKAKEFSNTITTYQYDDPELTPLSYYRLKMVDLDGSYKYSNTISLKRELINGFTRIYPNPTQGQITVHANIPKDTEGIIEVYNIVGKLFKSENINSDFQGIVQKNIDLSNLPKGSYILRLKNMNDVKSITVIKN